MKFTSDLRIKADIIDATNIKSIIAFQESIDNTIFFLELIQKTNEETVFRLNKETFDKKDLITVEGTSVIEVAANIDKIIFEEIYNHATKVTKVTNYDNFNTIFMESEKIAIRSARGRCNIILSNSNLDGLEKNFEIIVNKDFPYKTLLAYKGTTVYDAGAVVLPAPIIIKRNDQNEIINISFSFFLHCFNVKQYITILD